MKKKRRARTLASRACGRWPALRTWWSVWGSGLRVQGSGFRVQGSGFRVQGSGFGVQGSRFRVQGSLAGAENLVERLGFRDWSFIAEQPALAPHLAHPKGCDTLRFGV